MFSKIRFLMPFLFALALAVGIANLSTVQAAEKEKTEDEKPHCIAQASENEKVTAEVKPACFKTFSEAIRTATNGAVNLPEDIDPSKVTEEMLKAPNAGWTVIGIEYNWKKYRTWGGTLTVFAANSVGCSTGYSYGLSYVGGSWNDRISSARAYGNCSDAIHYQHAGFSGSSIDCGSGCPTMGSMNNKTSSIRWSP